MILFDRSRARCVLSPMRTIQRGRPRGSVAAKIAVLVLVAVAAVVALVIVSRPEQPNEANRVHTAQGMSMVKPQGWIATPHVGGDDEIYTETLTLKPAAWQGIAPTLFARALRAAPTAESLAEQGPTDVVFQGEHVPSRYYTHVKDASRDVLVSRSGRYFEVGLLIAGRDAEPMKSDWWAFVQTFHYDPQPMPATRPAIPQLGPMLPPDQNDASH
jgi:hypothetical protein